MLRKHAHTGAIALASFTLGVALAEPIRKGFYDVLGFVFLNWIFIWK
jgi:hypothetical protein